MTPRNHLFVVYTQPTKVFSFAWPIDAGILVLADSTTIFFLGYANAYQFFIEARKHLYKKPGQPSYEQLGPAHLQQY